MVKYLVFAGSLLCCISIRSFAQPRPADSALTLDQCVAYALKNQPLINQALVNTAITRTSNDIALAGWLPQVNASGNLTHYNTLPTTFFKNSSGVYTQQKTGMVNTATAVLGVTQTIFNPALVYAAHSAPLYVQNAEQITDSIRIEIVSVVSKDFYGLLLTLANVNVLREDTARLDKTVSDTYHQYVSGIVDETDYDQAVISLNNSKFQLRQATGNLSPQYAALKQAMGYPPTANFNVQYDTSTMMRDIAFDTTQQLQFEKRVEYQVLQTQKRLQTEQVNYYKLAWLPTVGGFFNYNIPFYSNSFGGLFQTAYPYNYLGLSVTVPVFTGLARTNSIKRARLQADLLNWSEVDLKSQIYTEYAAALSAYKSNYYNLTISRYNVDLAKRTYDIVKLQYLQGVVPYLNVITAESNLITSEIGYQTALYQLLASKIDLQKSMGFITVNGKS
jgi:outer membrane protein, multidrug efflux system